MTQKESNSKSLSDCGNGKCVDPDARVGVPSFEMGTVLKRWGGDTGFVHKLIASFMEGAPSQIRELVQVIANGDVGEATRLSHGLKGAAAYCGAEPFRIVAAELEAVGKTGDLSDAYQLVNRLQVELDRCLVYDLHSNGSVVQAGEATHHSGK
jgi:HPt (histidine-containing phosphotransfer) domain-containing protein